MALGCTERTGGNRQRGPVDFNLGPNTDGKKYGQAVPSVFPTAQIIVCLPSGLEGCEAPHGMGDYSHVPHFHESADPGL